jgi:hypothetical protein
VEDPGAGVEDPCGGGGGCAGGWRRVGGGCLTGGGGVGCWGRAGGGCCAGGHAGGWSCGWGRPCASGDLRRGGFHGARRYGWNRRGGGAMDSWSEIGKVTRRSRRNLGISGRKLGRWRSLQWNPETIRKIPEGFVEGLSSGRWEGGRVQFWYRNTWGFVCKNENIYTGHREGLSLIPFHF